MIAFIDYRALRLKFYDTQSSRNEKISPEVDKLKAAADLAGDGKLSGKLVGAKFACKVEHGNKISEGENDNFFLLHQ
jgi:hypothetical protein